MINTKEVYNTLRDKAYDSTVEALYMLSDYRGSTYIYDAISERADSRVDIYTRDLIEWAGNHICDIDSAADELGKPDSFLGWIQQAQFIVFERELYEGLDEAVIIKAWRIASEYAEEVTDEQADQINDLNFVIDNNNRISDIEDEVKQILNIEE